MASSILIRTTKFGSSWLWVVMVPMKNSKFQFLLPQSVKLVMGAGHPKADIPISWRNHWASMNRSEGAACSGCCL